MTFWNETLRIVLANVKEEDMKRKVDKFVVYIRNDREGRQGAPVTTETFFDRLLRAG